MASIVKVRTTDVTASLIEATLQPGIHDLYARTRIAQCSLKASSPIVPQADDYFKVLQTNGIRSAFEGLVKIPDSSQPIDLRTGIQYSVAAQGWEALLDTIIITASYTIAAGSVDAAVLADILSLYYAPIATSVTHALYPARTDLNAMILNAGQWTLRSFLDWLSAEAGGVTWWIDIETKAVHYNDGENVAPFILSDTPDARQTYFQEVLTDAPLAYWRLNGTDVNGKYPDSGSGNNPLTAVGGVKPSAPLVDDGDAGLALDGTTGLLNAPNVDSLSPATISIEAWCYFSAYTGFAGVMTNKSGSTDGIDIMFSTAQGIGAIIAGAYCAGYDEVGLLPTAGKRYHVVITYDPTVTTTTVYVNGVQTRQRTDLTMTHLSGQPWQVGSVYNYAYSLMTGIVDEVAIYSTVLSATRIAAHYTARVKANLGYQSLTRSQASDGRRVRVTTDDGNGNTYTATDWEKWQELNAKTSDEPGVAGSRIPESPRIVDSSLGTAEALKRRAWATLAGMADRRSFDVTSLTEGLQIGQLVDLRSSQYGTLDGSGNPVAPHPFLDQWDLMVGSSTQDLDTAMGRYLITKVTPKILGRDKWLWDAQVGDRDQVAAAMSTRGGNAGGRIAVPDRGISARMLDPTTVRLGKVTSYGPFQWVSPAQNVGPASSVPMTLPDGSTRIIVPNKCWISRVYATLKLDWTGGTISFILFRNGSPPAAAPNVYFTWQGTLDDVTFRWSPLLQLGANGSPVSAYYGNFSGLAPYTSSSPGNTNLLAAGDYLTIGGTTDAAFTPFGAGQVLSVYLETTDYA